MLAFVVIPTSTHTSFHAMALLLLNTVLPGGADCIPSSPLIVPLLLLRQRRRGTVILVERRVVVALLLKPITTVASSPTLPFSGYCPLGSSPLVAPLLLAVSQTCGKQVDSAALTEGVRILIIVSFN